MLLCDKQPCVGSELLKWTRHVQNSIQERVHANGNAKEDEDTMCCCPSQERPGDDQPERVSMGDKTLCYGFEQRQ
jgi:hypothetical protein